MYWLMGISEEWPPYYVTGIVAAVRVSRILHDTDVLK
jgi:hypothetical protein